MKLKSKILITSLIHGDEVGSERIVEKLQNLVPEVDYIRKLNKTGKRDFEGMDPNRSFPDKTTISKMLSKKLVDYDAVIDIHCAGNCHPFILVDRTTMSDEICSWASWSGIPVAIEGSTAYEEELETSWAGYAANKGKRAITIEVHSTDDIFDDICVKAILNLVHFYDSSKSGIIYTRENIETDLRGKIEWFVNPGEKIISGRKLCEINGQQLLSKWDGIILSLGLSDTVSDDGYLGMIGK